MRALLPLLLTCLAAGAAACTTTPAPPVAVGPVNQPPPIENYDWLFYSDADEASLAFGLDESDDVWLDLDCRRGAGTLVMVAPVPPDAPRAIRLEAGGESAAYAAEAEPSELHEGVFLVASASPTDAVFQRFRQTGWMTIEQAGERHPMVPHPGSAARIERFFAFCG